MSYASGGLIQATDYNNLAWGGTQGTYTAVTNNIAYVMGVGSGAFGYGQNLSQINTVSAAATVTAAQWAGLVYLLNRAIGHQSGSGSQLATGGNINMTAGETITYFANVATAVGTINTNKALYSAQGSTTTGSNFDEGINTSGALSGSVYGARTVTFASADAARYFFNAGGQLNYVVSTPTAAGSGRNANFVGLINGLGGWGQLNTTSSGRTGTGQTLNTNSTTFGYRNNVINSATSVVAVTSTAGSYTSDTAAIQVYTTSSDTTNGANGLNVIFRSIYTVGDKTWDDTINVTHRTRVDIVYPETTYLSTAWGTPTVS